MDDLFEQLKSAPPVNKYVNEAPPPPTVEKTKLKTTTTSGAKSTTTAAEANEVGTKMNGKAKQKYGEEEQSGKSAVAGKEPAKRLSKDTSSTFEQIPKRLSTDKKDANKDKKVDKHAGGGPSATIPAKKTKLTSGSPKKKEMIPIATPPKKENSTITKTAFAKKEETKTSPTKKDVTSTTATVSKKKEATFASPKKNNDTKPEQITPPKKKATILPNKYPSTPHPKKKELFAPPKKTELTTPSPKKKEPIRFPLDSSPPLGSKKATPTKAQQKSFEAVEQRKEKEPHKKSHKKATIQKIKTKRCMVRVKRENLIELQKNHLKERLEQKNSVEKRGRKRKIVHGADKNSPPVKVSRSSSSSPDKNTNFFIKLAPPPSAVKSKQAEKSKTKSSSKNSSNLKSNTAATNKFSKKSSIIGRNLKYSELYKKFGKRFFSCFVRMQRCRHPLLLTFEMNERAKKEQAQKLKKNKSKNLSVSFKEQVEIFGESGSSSDDEDYDNVLNASTSKDARQIAGPSPLLVTPARLKKVENGKVVADIKLDSSLFIDPATAASSTPIHGSPGRKRHDKKYSPLKDDFTPSPRKEILKLANEKLPQGGLRGFNIVDDEEDEDDEYIVPTTIPVRRPSGASSISAENVVESKEDDDAADDTEANSKKKTSPVTDIDADSTKGTLNSSESFASAKENIDECDANTKIDDSTHVTSEDVVDMLNSLDAIINSSAAKCNRTIESKEPEAVAEPAAYEKSIDGLGVAGTDSAADLPLDDKDKEKLDKALEDISSLDLFNAAGGTSTLIESPTFLDGDSNNDLVETINKLSKDFYINVNQGGDQVVDKAQIEKNEEQKKDLIL